MINPYKTGKSLRSTVESAPTWHLQLRPHRSLHDYPWNVEPFTIIIIWMTSWGYKLDAEENR